MVLSQEQKLIITTPLFISLVKKLYHCVIALRRFGAKWPDPTRNKHEFWNEVLLDDYYQNDFTWWKTPPNEWESDWLPYYYYYDEKTGKLRDLLFEEGGFGRDQPTEWMQNHLINEKKSINFALRKN